MVCLQRTQYNDDQNMVSLKFTEFERLYDTNGNEIQSIKVVCNNDKSAYLDYQKRIQSYVDNVFKFDSAFY